MKALGCFGMMASFAAGCAVTFTILTLRPLADPIGQLVFSGSRQAEEKGSLVGDIESALRVVTASIQPAGAPRTWTHVDGRQVRATLLSATSHTVTIKRESDGRVFTIRLDMLGAGDREFVRRYRPE